LASAGNSPPEIPSLEPRERATAPVTASSRFWGPTPTRIIVRDWALFRESASTLLDDRRGFAQMLNWGRCSEAQGANKCAGNTAQRSRH